MRGFWFESVSRNAIELPEAEPLLIAFVHNMSSTKLLNCFFIQELFLSLYLFHFTQIDILRAVINCMHECFLSVVKHQNP